MELGPLTAACCKKICFVFCFAWKCIARLRDCQIPSLDRIIIRLLYLVLICALIPRWPCSRCVRIILTPWEIVSCVINWDSNVLLTPICPNWQSEINIPFYSTKCHALNNITYLLCYLFVCRVGNFTIWSRWELANWIASW